MCDDCLVGEAELVGIATTDGFLTEVDFVLVGGVGCPDLDGTTNVGFCNVRSGKINISTSILGSGLRPLGAILNVEVCRCDI